MPGYVETGLNFVGVEDVPQVTCLFLRKVKWVSATCSAPKISTLKQVLDTLAEMTGLRRADHEDSTRLALTVAYANTIFSRLTFREPQIPSRA